MAAVLTEPDAVKAAVLPDGGMIRYSFPIDKGRTQETEEINPVDGTPDLIIWGKATDGTLDSDLQIVDPDASLRWIKTWYDTKANIRMSHDPRLPVGKGLDIDGHYVKSLIADPKAKHFIRAGILNDYSVGIINPDLRDPRDPRFAHLPDVSRAVKGVITDRPDGLTMLGEISVVDRGANYGSAFSLVKAAADGTPEWTGTWTTEPPADEPEQPKAPKGVTLTLPKDVSVTMKPSDLAKLATFRQRLVTQHAAVKTAAQAAAPAVVNKAADITPPDPDEALTAAAKAAEAGIYKRDVSAGERRELRGQGRALDNLSYPVKTHEDADNAVSLILSGHGNVKAASRMVKRIARKEGWQDILDRLKGGKQQDKTAEPDLTKCMTCKDTGMAGGKPCTDCGEGEKAAKAAAALDDALTAPLETAEKKRKVMCGHCGAIQNVKHAHCPECGQPLQPGAMPVPKKVKKNHDFACLGCGRELDKGEKFCPDCGRENPGYLEAADHKIPANADKAAKERVSTDPDVTKGRKNKKAGKKVGKKNPFGGKQAPAFGRDADDDDDVTKAKKVKAKAKAKITVSDGDDDDDDDAAKSAASPAVAKRKGKGRDPGKGVKGRDGAAGTTGLPPHREPAPPASEAFDGDAEMKAAMRHKSAVAAYGITPAEAVLHDLTCPAFSPAMTGKYLPGHTLAGIDTAWWQAKAVDAASSASIHDAVTKYNEMSALSRAAVTLKTAEPDTMYRIAQSAHEAFLAANQDTFKTFRDATPGPGSAPTPGQVLPGTFRRPYISAGHAAPSPQFEGPRTFPVPDHHPEAQDYQRGYISAGHGSEAPANSGRPEPMPETGTGLASRAGDAAGIQARDYEAARNTMHDHLTRTAPGMCPMSPEPPGTQKPAPQVPSAVGAPEPHAAGKTAKPTRAEKAAAKARAAKQRARKLARAEAAKRRKVESQVFKGKLTVDQGREKLGLEPFGLPETATKAATATGEPAAPEPAQLTPEAFAAAVKAATAPMAKQIRAQDKALRRLAKTTDAIANQPDTTGALYRGAGTAAYKTSAAAAPPRTPAEAAELARTGYLQRLRDDWRNSSNPEVREAAWQELTAQLGLNPMTGNEPVTHPFRT